MNPEKFCLSNARVWKALRSPLRLQLLEAIRARPGIDARALSTAIQASPPRLYYHLKILLESGLIVQSDESERQGSRGPAAVLYRPAFERFPAGFFDGDPRTIARRGKVMREIAELGLGYVASEHMSARVSADFRHETLHEQEIEAVFKHVAEIRRIVESARLRRHREKVLVRATAFVGICVSTVETPVLPDGPLEAELALPAGA
jgi:DNA-binding transcriptional ArsR family regulator